MATALVQTTSAAYSIVISVNLVWAGNTTSGNQIVVAWSCSNTLTRAVRVTDTQGNKYFPLGIAVSGTTAIIQYWIARNIVGGTTPTITVTLDSANTGGVFASEYSGFVIGISPDTTSVSSASSISPSSGATFVTTAPNGLSVAMVVQSTGTPTFTAGGAYGNLTLLSAGTVRLAIEDVNLTAVASQTATFGSTASGGWTCKVINFKDGPMPTTNNNYQFLKVGDGMSVGERIR